MQAKDFYSIGVKAYYSDESARKAYFEKLSKIAIPIAEKYGLLPSYIMAKSVCESGYMTDIWNATAEKLSGKKFKKKAQDYNNIFGMNCWKDNQEYLDTLPLPAWNEYKTSFEDFGPHGYGDTFHVKWEPWKSYKTIEDAIEDWCANIRYQSAKHGFVWNPADLISQLLATESYTPEGSPEGVRKELHFQWQESIMQYYEKYDLKKYDDEVKNKKMEQIKMNEENLDEYIKEAYEYAHAHCHYAPCFSIPPMTDNTADCVSLAFRALYRMGYMDETFRSYNINLIPRLCEKAGMKKSTNIEDVWKHHGIVLMQGNNLYNTAHVTHVYYSLGGTGVNDISKYDLGSDKRIKENQPYKNVPVNQWEDKYHFLAIYYTEKAERNAVKDYKTSNEFLGYICKDVGIYSGPGTSWKKLGTLKRGTRIVYGLKITNEKGKAWRRVWTNGMEGYIYHSAVMRNPSFKSYKAVVKELSDGFAALRVGASVDDAMIDKIKSGTSVLVNGSATSESGEKWLHVKVNNKHGFILGDLVEV